ncbi:MAG TPA: transporter substrate-binding domain-containing protein, partial [Myxococcota bacterium]|nr:transporter substrate-binding domain-containing protein [Myxococcota bacterium]
SQPLPSRSASPPPAPPVPSRPLRVGTSGDYAPFSIWPEADPGPRGFSVDLARSFAADEALELQWVRFRWPDLLEDLEAGRFDLALSGVTLRPERSTAGRTSVPLAASGAIVLVPRALPIATGAEDTWIDRPGFRLAVNAGGHLEQVARSRFPTARIEAIADNAAVLERLASGAVDGVVTDDIEAPHWQARWQALEPTPPAGPRLERLGPFTRDLKIGLWRPDRQELGRRFDAWLMAAEATGRLDRLRRLHGLPTKRTASVGPALHARLDERLSLMPAVARVKRELDQPVEDRERERRVLEAARRSVAGAAARAGQPPPSDRALDRLFRVQIEAAKWIQQRAGGEPSSPERSTRSREAARRELDTLLRPALIRLGDQQAELLVAWLARPDPGPERDAIERALVRHALPERLLDELASALSALRTDAAGSGSTPRRPPAGSDTAPTG